MAKRESEFAFAFLGGVLPVLGNLGPRHRGTEDAENYKAGVSPGSTRIPDTDRKPRATRDRADRARVQFRLCASDFDLRAQGPSTSLRISAAGSDARKTPQPAAERN